MNENILQKISVHDRYQIEIKYDYIIRGGEKSRYSVSTYFFIPPSLGINATTYDSIHFYRDAQSYIRLKTPEFTLKEISLNPESPLNKVKEITRKPDWSKDDQTNEQVIRYLKLLGAMIKSAIREHINLVEVRLKNAPPEADKPAQTNNIVDEFILECQSIRLNYKALYSEFNRPLINPDPYDTYLLMDEAISLLIEEGIIKIIGVLDQNYDKSTAKTYRGYLGNVLEAELDHRKQKGYSSSLSDKGDNEEALFRISAIKKFWSSILFLTFKYTREGRGLETILMSIAAGISMIFATIIAFYFQQRYGNLTFPFFIALVVGYMFKDRIKGLFQHIFKKQLEDKLFDRRISIYTQDHKYKLGTFREKVGFLTENEIPADVLALRNRQPMVNVNNDGVEEKVICYTKAIQLDAGAFTKILNTMPGIVGINDIIRFDVRSLLNKMDDPVEERPIYKDGEVVLTKCRRVYQVNIISQSSAIKPEFSRSIDRFRLVLNRKGIYRIETI